jgi:hypothetical protein
MSTTAREIAEQIFRWVNDERVDPVTFGLRTAGMDRGLVRQAMDIVRDELVPAAAEADVDREYAERGRYMTSRERRAALAAAPPARTLTAADRAEIERRIRDAALEVKRQHPDVGLEEFERRVRKRLAEER